MLSFYAHSYAHSHGREKRQLSSSCPFVRPSVCPLVSPLLSAPLPLDGSPSDLTMSTYTKICRESPNLAKIGQKYLTLYIETDVRKFDSCWRRRLAMRALCLREMVSNC